MTSHKQTTDGNEYTTRYTYNLSGALIEQTYPSGRVVKNTLDADGSLALVQSKKNASDILRPFASNFLYNAAGAVTAMRLGNGRWENTEFNSRLQPTKIGLGSGVASQSLLKLEYSYGTTANNGNVVSQTITVPGLSNPFVQSYSYDELNRISTATETNNSVQTWQQAFSYDRYGNRNFNESLTTTLPKNCGTSPNYAVCSTDVPIVNPSVNTANNRLSGTTYDAAGNVITDAEGRQFTYDAENKQIEAKNSSNATLGTYYFDGDGKRIKKIVPGTGEVTIFVYDASGKLIQEHSTIVASSQDAKTQYLTNDHLGTPRINTNSTGQIVSRSDYMPYGEEIVGLGNRSSNDKYVADDIRQRFTGYENDGETGLDFAQARYYSNTFGRFSTPDPYNIILEVKAEKDPEDAKAKLIAYLTKAQQWNRYAYVINNPLIYLDPTGETLELTGTQKEKDEAFNRILELCGEGCGLYIHEKDGRTFVEYNDTNGGPSWKVASIGQVLEDIIDSNTNVELQYTSKSVITWAEHGDSENLDNRTAVTRPISSERIQIFISTTQSMNTVADRVHYSGARGEDGSKLTFTKSIQLAHELGHAWGAIKDRYVESYNRAWIKSTVMNQNQLRSVQVENWQRNRLGLTRRANH